MRLFLVLVIICISSFILAQSLHDNGSMHGTDEVYNETDITQPQFIKFKTDYNLPINKLSGWVNQNMRLGDGVSLKLQQTKTDNIGITHHRYTQFYHGIPVRAGVFYFHENNNTIVSGNGKIFKLTLDIQPCVHPETALKTAEQHINANQYKVNGTIINRTPDFDVNQLYAPELIVIAEYLDYENPAFRLAWEVVLYGVNPLSHDKIYVDANTGDIIAKENRICTIDAQGTAVSKYNGTINITTDSTGPNLFRLYESGRGGGIHTLNFQQGTSNSVEFTDTDNFWDNVNPQQDEIATDAHYGTERTYDYYFLEHGRNSYDDNGAPLISNVHYDFNYANAFWDGSTMTYGDGDPTTVLDKPLTTMDVCAHEITHGVTEFTANLIYIGESGGLNESFSDIFGNAIEYYADSTIASWRLGEQCTSTGLGIRNMANPNEFSNPDTYQGNYWGNGVHNDSGVQNYWFYLLANGGSGTNDIGGNYNINPIGWKKAEQIAYRNLSVYLTPSSNYYDARFYSIKATEDLFGGCSQEVIEVTNAWHAVGVGVQFNPVLSPDFTVTLETICDLADSTEFSALGNGISTFFWDFGDGNTSTLRNPSHIYSQIGTYTVSLKVTDCNGVMDSLTKTNYITADPMSSFCDTIVLLTQGIDSSNQCSGVLVDPGGILNDYPNNSDVVFTINPPGAINFLLTFQVFDLESGYDYLTVYDGPTTSSPAIGTYSGSTIPASITSTNGSLTIRFTSDGSVSYPGFLISWMDISNGQSPIANYTIPVPTPHNWPILFNNQSLFSGDYSWDFGDGTTSLDEHPTHLYSTSGGTYITSLEAINCFGSDTAFQSITIDAPSSLTIDPDTISITLNQGDTALVPVTITNSGNGVGYYGTNISSGGNLILLDNQENYFTNGATTNHPFNNIPGYVDTIYLTIVLNGDFDGNSEYASLLIDGTNLGQIVDNNLPNGTNISVNYELTGIALTNWLADGILNIEIINSSDVGFGVGGDDSHDVTIAFKTLEWIDFNSFNGNTPANSTEIVNIHFDARQVTGGTTYIYDIPISTNDLNNPTENIHCKLFIIANAISDFKSSDSITCDGTVLFNDLSQNNPVSWEWDFGDGNTSTDQNPTHNYLNTGMYDVTLITCNQVDCDTLTKVAYVNYDPTTTICQLHNLPTNSSTTLAGCTGTLFDNSGPNANYQNASNDTIFILPPSAISITLTFSLFELENSYDYLFVYDGPTTNSPQIGAYTGNMLPPVITSSSGALTIVMMADNSVSAEGFEATWQCVQPAIPPNAGFSHSYPDFCNGVVQFIDQSVNALSWNWDFGDGATSTLKNPMHDYATPGSYNVTLIAGNNHGTDTLQQMISADPFIASVIIPDTMFTGIPEVFDNTSPGALYSTWHFGDGNTSTQEDPLVSYANVGVYNVSLLTAHGNGCTDSLSHDVTVLPSTAIGIPDKNQTTVKLFPVPSEGPVQLSIHHQQDKDITIQAFNSTGQLIFRLSDYSDGSYIRLLNFNDEAAGIYLLQIKVGDETFLRKIVLQH